MSDAHKAAQPLAPGAAPVQEGGYLRVLTPFDATMLVVGCIIGGGVFFNPSKVAAHAHAPAAILVAWALGGLVALTGALSYAELGGLYPRAGGLYIFLREAFGRLPAFLCGWSVLLIIAPGALAVVADFFAENLRTFWPAIGDGEQHWIATGVILLLTALNIRGVRLGSYVLNFFTLGKLAALGGIVVAGLVWHGAPVTALPAASAPAPLGTGSLHGVLLALVPILFTYGGWQNATFVAAEIREPARNVPRAMLIGTLIVIAVYLSVNYAFVRVLDPAVIATERRFATEAARLSLGDTGACIVAIGILLSTFGICSAMLLTNPRLVQTISADGCFFRQLGELHPRWRTPARAITVQGLWSIALLWSGKAGELLDSVVFADWTFFALAALSLFVLRRKYPDAPRPYRCPLYPWIPLVFLVLSITTMWAAIDGAGARSLWLGVGLLTAGVPVYWYFERSRAASNA